MKITSGLYKYRNIEIPKGIRPTTEKVREAIFSMIRDWIPEATVLDLFAGSGALGLEVLSRGASKCIFNEINRQNFKVLHSNISNCKADGNAVLLNFDYKTCLTKLDEKLDIVIMDPPYEEVQFYESAMKLLQDNNLLEEGSIVITEHVYDNKLSETYGKLTKIKEKKYGTIGVDVFEYQD